MFHFKIITLVVTSNHTSFGFARTYFVGSRGVTISDEPRKLGWMARHAYGARARHSQLSWHLSELRNFIQLSAYASPNDDGPPGSSSAPSASC